MVARKFESKVNPPKWAAWVAGLAVGAVTLVALSVVGVVLWGIVTVVEHLTS